MVHKDTKEKSTEQGVRIKMKFKTGPQTGRYLANKIPILGWSGHSNVYTHMNSIGMIVMAIIRQEGVSKPPP